MTTPLEAFSSLAADFLALTIEKARAVIAEECVVHEAAGLPGVAGEWRGPAGFVALMQMVGRTFPNFRFTLEKLISNDSDTLVIKGRISGDTPGGRFDIPLVEFWSFRDGKAVDILPVWHDTKLVHDLYSTAQPQSASADHGP